MPKVNPIDPSTLTSSTHQDADKNRNLVLRWIAKKYADRGQPTTQEIDSIRFREYMLIRAGDECVEFSFQPPNTWPMGNFSHRLTYNQAYDFPPDGPDFRRWFTVMYKHYCKLADDAWDKFSSPEV